MATTQVSLAPAMLLLLAALAALVLLASAGTVGQVPKLTMPKPAVEKLPPLTAHALRHPDAVEAWNWVEGHGTHCRWSCPDGRTRWVCSMPGNRWALVVVEGLELVTAFTIDQDYALGVISGCKNPWRYSHP